MAGQFFTRKNIFLALAVLLLSTPLAYATTGFYTIFFPEKQEPSHQNNFSGCEHTVLVESKQTFFGTIETHRCGTPIVVNANGVMLNG